MVPLSSEGIVAGKACSGAITFRFVPLQRIKDYLVAKKEYSDMANILDPMDLKQIITSVLGISRNTVNTYMQLFAASDYSLEELLGFDNAALDGSSCPPCQWRPRNTSITRTSFSTRTNG